VVLRYARWLQRHRLWVYLLCALLAGLSSTGLYRFAFKVDYRTFFASEALGFEQFRHMEENFSPSDDIAFVLEPADSEVFSEPVIESLLWLKQALSGLPFIKRVESLTDYPFQTHVDGELYVGYVTDKQSEPYTLSFFRDLARDDPMLAGTLVGKTGKTVAILAKYQLAGENDLLEFPAAMQAVNEVKKQFRERYPGTRLAVAGVLTYNHGIIQTATEDLLLLLPACSLIILVILYFFLRSRRGALFTMLIIGLTLSSTLGLWCWLGIPLNSASISGPIAILALAVADCVHLADTYLLLGRENPRADSRTRMTESLLLNYKAIFLTSLTSALGFLTLNFCESPPYQDIGNLVAIGIVFAWLYSVTLFPALAGQFGLRDSASQLHLNRLLHRLADMICRHYPKVLLGYGVIIILSLSWIPFNELDDNVVEWFDADVEFRRDAEYIDRHHTGMYQLYYVFDSGQPKGALEPAILNEVSVFAEWLRSQEEVVQARSLADLLASSYSAMTGRERSLPRDRMLTLQILDSIEMLADDRSRLQALINEDRSALRMHVSLNTMRASEFIAFERRSQAWLQANTEIIKINSGGISPSMMFARLSQQVVPTMLVTTAIMILLISALLIFIFRSLPLGLLSLAPNLLPVGMAFGFWGLFSGHVGIALSIVSGASLGIVVDDTIHLLLKYQRARQKKGMTPPEAVRFAITYVGDALTITTLTLVSGFLILGFSSLQPNAELGMMLGGIIGMALITDLLFVPALLLWIEERKPLFRLEKHA